MGGSEVGNDEAWVFGHTTVNEESGWLPWETLAFFEPVMSIDVTSLGRLMTLSDLKEGLIKYLLEYMLSVQDCAQVFPLCRRILNFAAPWRKVLPFALARP